VSPSSDYEKLVNGGTTVSDIGKAVLRQGSEWPGL
jgi:hypothetical protein